MKMGAGMFWGIVIILIGLSVLLKGLNIHFPIFKIVIGILFIYFGIKIITGGFGHKTFHGGKNEVIFGEKEFTTENVKDQEYNVLFAKGLFDLTNVSPQTPGQHLKINTVFGASELRIKKNMPVKLTISTAFGSAKLPNGNSTALGTTHYSSENLKEQEPFFDIKADVVFGALDIVEVE